MKREHHYREKHSRDRDNITRAALASLFSPITMFDKTKEKNINFKNITTETTLCRETNKQTYLQCIVSERGM